MVSAGDSVSGHNVLRLIQDYPEPVYALQGTGELAACGVSRNLLAFDSALRDFLFQDQISVFVCLRAFVFGPVKYILVLLGLPRVCTSGLFRVLRCEGSVGRNDSVKVGKEQGIGFPGIPVIDVDSKGSALRVAVARDRIFGRTSATTHNSDLTIPVFPELVFPIGDSREGAND